MRGKHLIYGTIAAGITISLSGALTHLPSFLVRTAQAAAQSQPHARVADRLVGNWKLVAMEGPRVAEGAEPPQGLLVYTSSGAMAIQMMFGNRPRFASEDKNRATSEEVRAAFDGYAAYFGTFSVRESEGAVIHRVDGSLFPNNVGSEQKRYYSLSGNRLTLSVSPPAAAQQGMRLVFERTN